MRGYSLFKICVVEADAPGFGGRRHHRLADAVLDEPLRREFIDIDDAARALLDAGVGVALEKFDLRHGFIPSG